ncbi:MAG: pyridoxal phosphate-dependent aminotransferase [Lachnospiraceae bacterium]|nr:pyridoxal phosphate-dependent aminotransferase [Lachnospiraceae bacterium]MDD7628840.1 pyridoxal phosphate-dependent aminotransferase [Lachnospiraceae bacterium]MDY4120335.1 MalY/PatB family protein [Lachnospiraceae bacterium]
MAERNLDFDKVVDRKNTSCLKYDFAVKRGMPADILPLWVADMDFKTSSYIQDAVAAQAEHGIYGYTESGDSYFEAVQSWFFTHYDWKVEEKWLVKTPGVVFALAMAVQAFTQENDAVMIQQPVYYPFSGVIKDNGRRIIDNTLVQDEVGNYHMDIADFEEKIVKEQVKLFFLCNPHNPVGRAWTREELEKIGDICYKHHVLIVSDEIHADFVYNRKHQVLVNLKKEYEEITITCTAPSKTFNIAGLQVSNIFIPDNQLRHRFKRQIAASGYSQLNAAGLVACEAAYRYGEEWYNGVKAYIRENISFTKKFLEERIPKVKMLEPEGTYLVWVDFRALGLSNRELEDLIIHKAGLWLDSGAIFGAAGEGFQRINVACPRVTLQTALEKIETAVNNL